VRLRAGRLARLCSERHRAPARSRSRRRLLTRGSSAPRLGASLSAEACGCGFGRGGLRACVLSATEPRPAAAPAAGFLREGVARRVLAPAVGGVFESSAGAPFLRFPSATIRRARFALRALDGAFARAGLSWGEVELVYIWSICRVYVVYKVYENAHF
jgi:hypothetical protein